MTEIERNAHRGDPHAPGRYPDSGFHHLQKGYAYLRDGVELVEPATPTGYATLMRRARALAASDANASMSRAELDALARSVHVDPTVRNKGRLAARIKAAGKGAP